MAYIQQLNDDEEQQQAGQGPEKVLSQGAATADNGQADAQGAASQQTTPGKAKGSGWTNLVDYVSANKGAGEQMASKVGQNIQNQGNVAQQSGQNYKTTADTTINAATPTRDQSVIDDVSNDPTKVTGERAQKFQAMKNASYAGPKAAQEVAGYQDVQGAYNNTAKAADDTADFEARRGLLNNAYGNRNDYTAGESRLDSFLTGTDGAQQLANTKQSFGQGSDFQKGWGDLVSSVSGNIASADTAAKGINADANLALDTAVKGVDKSFADYGAKATATNDVNTKAYQTLDNNLRSEDPKARAAGFAEIGLQPEVGEWLMSQGYSLQQLVSAGQGMKGGDYASEQDLAKAQALYGLKGTNIDPNMIAKSKGDSSPYAKNTKALESGTTAYKMQRDLESRLAEKQAARDSELSQLLNGLKSSNRAERYAAGAKLGLDPADVDAKTRPEDFITGGSKLTAGDVASNEERQTWANLIQSLGIASPADFTDTQEEGGAYAFDHDKFKAALDPQRRAEQDLSKLVKGGNDMPASRPSGSPGAKGTGKTAIEKKGEEMAARKREAEEKKRASEALNKMMNQRIGR